MVPGERAPAGAVRERADRGGGEPAPGPRLTGQAPAVSPDCRPHRSLARRRRRLPRERVVGVSAAVRAEPPFPAGCRGEGARPRGGPRCRAGGWRSRCRAGIRAVCAVHGKDSGCRGAAGSGGNPDPRQGRGLEGSEPLRCPALPSCPLCSGGRQQRAPGASPAAVDSGSCSLEIRVCSPAVGVPDERGCVSLLPARGPPCPLPAMEYVDMNKLSCGKKTRVEGGQLGGDEWTRHGSFVNKPTRGWLHPDDKVMGSGVSYHVRYMGCVEVLQSMRALDFNTRTQVTREAIGLVCEAVPGAKGAVRRRKPCSRSLNSILGKSNLKFAGMPITLTISTSSLNLMASDCKQIIANHHMQSISFASGGDPDTAEYVAYVAKDPVNQRACHILECPEGLAQDVISTIGQAFELRFKQYLKNPPKLVTPHDRMAGFDGSAWDEEEEEPAPDHQYYNDFPGKEPPIGGVVDMRLQDGAAQTPNHLGATLPVGQSSGGEYDPQKQHAPAQGREKYPAAAGTSGRTDLFDDPSYVNVQNVDKTRQAPASGTPATANGSTQRDLFDMKPFEDALRVPPSVPLALPPAQVVASMEEQLRREPWYHGKMSRKEAEKLLKVNGDFLVRESTTTPGQYVLTGLQGGQPKHLLLVDPEGVVRTKDHRFESVSHLISYHMDNHLPIISAGSEMCLQQPVERRL